LTSTDRKSKRSESALRSSGFARYSDRAFALLLLAAGLSVLVILGAMVIRTTVDAWPVFQYQGFFSFLFGPEWQAGFSRNEFTGTYGAWPFIYGTLFVAAIAVVLALPLAIAVSLYITQYAPIRVRTATTYLVEVLAAVPSIVFGLWGLLYFIPNYVQPVSNFVNRTLGAVIPFFGGSVPNVNYFHAGVVLGIMILPIITAITREIVATAPIDEQEAGYGLGATKWEVLRKIVLPRSFAGIVGATMLGLGRALGETIAVLMLVGGSQRFAGRLFFAGDTMAAHIAATFQDASPETLVALLGIGVVLFIVTAVVNMIARLIVWQFGQLTGDAL
jgi:phosphate transport system permease protein